MGAFDAPPPASTARSSREPGRSSVAVLRAASYDGDLEEIVPDGLRLVGRRRARASASCSSRTSSSSSRARRSTPTRGWWSRPRTRCGGSAPRSVVVAEGPGHRRDTEAIASRQGCSTRSTTPACGSSISTPRRSCGRRSETRYTGLARAVGAARPARHRARRVDAEAEDAPLGRGHDVAEELLRLHARPRLRVAEERLPLARDPEVDPRHRAAVRPSPRDRRRDRRHAGRRPDHGRSRSSRASSSSRATPSPRTSPARA